MVSPSSQSFNFDGDRIKIDPKALEAAKQGKFNNIYMKVKTTANGKTWSIKYTDSPKVKSVTHSIENVFKGLSHEEVIDGKKLLSKLANAANDKEGVPADIKDFALKAKNLQTPENRKQEIENIKQRALKKAAVIGKGTAQMEKANIKPKILDEKYWMESLTPDHQYGSQINSLFSMWNKSDTKLSFEEWLHTNTATDKKKETLQIQNVKYLNAEERKDHKVTFANGKLQRSGQPYSTANEKTTFSGQGTAIFVIDGKKNLYAGSHILGKFHHSSFLGGGAIAGAGEIKTNPDGSIKEISSKSGHYKPTVEQNIQTLKIFADQGIDLKGVNFGVMHADGTVLIYDAKDYLESKGLCQPKSTTGGPHPSQ